MPPEASSTTSASELVAGAADQASGLVAIAPIELVNGDARKAARAATWSATAFGIAAIATLAGIQSLAFSYAIAIASRRRPARLVALGLCFFGAAAAAMLAAKAARPRSSLPPAALRIASDRDDIGTRVAR